MRGSDLRLCVRLSGSMRMRECLLALEPAAIGFTRSDAGVEAV